MRREAAANCTAKKNKWLGALLIDFLFEANYLIKNDNFATVGIKGDQQMLHFNVIWAKKIEKWSTMKRNSGIFALKSLDYSLPYAMLMQKQYQLIEQLVVYCNRGQQRQNIVKTRFCGTEMATLSTFVLPNILCAVIFWCFSAICCCG